MGGDHRDEINNLQADQIHAFLTLCTSRPDSEASGTCQDEISRDSHSELSEKSRGGSAP